jgi:hypothetical protein
MDLGLYLIGLASVALVAIVTWRMVFMKKSYTSLKQWEKDYRKFLDNPRDSRLLKTIVRRVKESPENIKKEIKRALWESALETNPWEVFSEVCRELPHKHLIVRTRQSPFFEV